jgi:hypothetical protein
MWHIQPQRNRPKTSVTSSDAPKSSTPGLISPSSSVFIVSDMTKRPKERPVIHQCRTCSVIRT